MGLGDGGVLLDLGRIVGAQILDEAILISDILDVAGDDLNAQLGQILGRLIHDLIGEGVTVRVDVLEGQGSHDLTHVALKGIHEIHGNLVSRLIEKVLCGQSNALRGGHDTDLGHCVHAHIDKIVGRHRAVSLDVYAHLTQVQPVHALQEGDAESGSADEHAGLLLHAGDKKGMVGRRLYIAEEEEHDDEDGGCDTADEGDWH